MIQTPRRIQMNRSQIIHLKIGHLFQNLFRTQTGGEKIEHINHPDAHPAYARTTTALFGVDGYSLK